ncbi:MAG: gluconokinase, partial [Moorea sp. SIO4A1]|uniref:gluconokinase n=1 Tax=Moorena sp. SIO4A1 TaxID=2607835 RepID=UPI00144BDC9A
MNAIIFIMGVSGSGKSTIGRALSLKMDIPFYDGDNFHSNENLSKMSQGQPLDDEDRHPWLASINKHARLQKSGAIYACSALKSSYRKVLEENLAKAVYWIFLNGDFDLIRRRLANR